MNLLKQLIFQELSVFTIIFLMSFSNVWGNDANNELLRRLDLLSKHYKDFPSLYFNATSSGTQKGDSLDKEIKGKILYTYWGHGQKYRMNVTMGLEEDQANWSTTQVAFDGKRHQNYDVTDSILRYYKEDTNVAVGVPPNPILYPVLFMSPSVQNIRSRLRVKDLSEDNIWENIISHAKVLSNDLSSGELEFEIPGGKADGEISESVFRVRLGKNPSFMPIEIQRVSADGSVSCRISIPSYNVNLINGQEKYIPKEINMETMDAGRTMSTENILFDSVEFGTDYPEGIFTIDYTQADFIYDEDIQLVIDTPQRTMPNLDSGNSGFNIPIDEVELSGSSSQIEKERIGDMEPDDMNIVSTEKVVSTLRRPWWIVTLWIITIFAIIVLFLVLVHFMRNN